MRWKIYTRRTAAIILVLLVSYSAAQTITPKAALERLFTSETLQDAWFTDAFLAEVPTAQLETLLTQITDQLGAYTRIEGDESPFTVVFAEGSATARITLNAQAQISGLFLSDLTPRTPNLGSVDEAIAGFEALPGQVGVIALEAEEERGALNVDTPLAVGSAFKLAVLSTLQDQIQVGTHAWDDVVTLKPGWKSLPSGILQDWPDDAPLTLQTLATLMISQSDNTATDALIAVVGRDAVEAKTERNRPFLTTREAFQLKGPANSKLLDRYRAGDEAAKRAVLQELQGLPLPSVDIFTDKPTALEVEWFFTARELCELMAQVQALPLMSVSPGVVDPDGWERIAFKGGSEPGVLNLTAWLTASGGASYCVSATQNQDAPIDEVAFISLYNGLVGTLR